MVSNPKCLERVYVVLDSYFLILWMVVLVLIDTAFNLGHIYISRSIFQNFSSHGFSIHVYILVVIGFDKAMLKQISVGFSTFVNSLD